MDAAECKTLWMGDLQPTWDEDFICSLFASTGEQPVVKLIRDKVTGYLSGYCFLEFPTQQGAQAGLDTLNGQIVPNTVHRFRLNWGSGGRRIEMSEDHSIFVGDLAPDVTDDVLVTTFSAHFASVRNAKVLLDPITRQSKGFGFVRFGNKDEAQQALTTMNGVYCLSRPMRVSVATDRTEKPRQQSGHPMMLYTPPYPTYHTPTYTMSHPLSDTDDNATNTTVFIGGLDATATEEDLRTRFSVIGDIVSVKIPPGKGCGFVHYATRDAAEVAIAQLNNTVINGNKIRCAWGRAAAVRAAQASAGGGGTTPTGSGTSSYYQQQQQQQYPTHHHYQQQQHHSNGYQNYYGYNGTQYYPQQQQQQHYPQQQYHHPQHQHANGYNGYAGGYTGTYEHPQSNYNQQAQSQQPQQQRDFTRPDDVDAMNRRYAAQRAYQHMPPVPNGSYATMPSDPATGTAMAATRF